MSALDRVLKPLRVALQSCAASASVFVRDVGNGLLEISHNALALLGLIAVGAVFFVATRQDLQEVIEAHAWGWLKSRHEAKADPAETMAEALSEPEAVSRATALDLRKLDKSQAQVAQWLSRRYRVAPEPIGRLVQEAWAVGAKVGLDPTLILAVMAVESSFNPFAQSTVGAQGLMQVMTRVHDAKYERFGGTHAAFDPVTNLRVGVQVLKECIGRAGSMEAGLRYYVGASNLADDGGYVAKVLAEQAHLRLVTLGKAVPVTAPLPLVVPRRIEVEDPAPSDTREVPSEEQVAMVR